MSFATLCLHEVHVRMADPQEEISPIQPLTRSTEDHPIFSCPLPHCGCPAKGSGQFAIGPVKFFGEA